MEELPKIIGENYMKIVAYMKELGESPVHEPYTAYHNMDMQDLDVEMGFPLDIPLPGKGDITAGEIPAGWVVAYLYQGVYAGMEPVYNEMFTWIAEHGYESTGVYYEYYLNSPMEVPESELLTRIELPVRKL